MPAGEDANKRKVRFPNKAAFHENEGYVYTLRALRAEAMHDAPAQVLPVIAATNAAREKAQRGDSNGDAESKTPAPEAKAATPITRLIDHDTSLEPPDSYYVIDDEAETTAARFRDVDYTQDPATRVDEPTERMRPFADGGGGPPLVALWPDEYHAEYEPEFEFEEEVESVVRDALKGQGKGIHVPLDNEEEVETLPEPGPSNGIRSSKRARSANAPHDQVDGPAHSQELEEFVDIPPEYLDTLTEQVSVMLSRIFTHLTLYRTVERPTQNILHTPMGWEEVLKFLDGSGIVSPSYALNWLVLLCSVLTLFVVFYALCARESMQYWVPLPAIMLTAKVSLVLVCIAMQSVNLTCHRSPFQPRTGGDSPSNGRS